MSDFSVADIIRGIYNGLPEGTQPWFMVGEFNTMERQTLIEGGFLDADPAYIVCNFCTSVVASIEGEDDRAIIKYNDQICGQRRGCNMQVSVISMDPVVIRNALMHHVNIVKDLSDRRLYIRPPRDSR